MVSFLAGTLSLYPGAGRFSCLCQSGLPRKMYAGPQPLFSGTRRRPAGRLQWSKTQRNRRNCELCPKNGPGDHCNRPHHPACHAWGICAAPGTVLTGAERASYFLCGCAEMSDRRERKSHAAGVFDRTQSIRPGAWGNPNKLHRNIENDIPMPCLPTFAEHCYP